MAHFGIDRQRLQRAAETASRQDTRPHQGYTANARLAYSIQAPPATFDSLDDDDRSRYCIAIAAAAHGDLQARQEACSTLRSAERDIAETARIGRIDDDLEYELARTTAVPQVRAALVPRTIKRQFRFTRDVNVESQTFEAGDEFHGDQLPVGTIKSLLSGGHAMELKR